MTEAQKQWHIRNRPRKLKYMRRYREENREATIQATRKWRAENPAKSAASKQSWADRNKEKVIATKRNYEAKHADRIRVSARERAAHRRETDLNFKLRERLRGQVYSALKRCGAVKAARTAALIGCDIQFLRGFLEARFLPGMTWANHGKWHIDHRIPCAEFDLREPAQQRQCFHYSNLKPMWGPDNIKKGAKRPASHQAEML